MCIYRPTRITPCLQIHLCVDKYSLLYSVSVQKSVNNYHSDEYLVPPNNLICLTQSKMKSYKPQIALSRLECAEPLYVYSEIFWYIPNIFCQTSQSTRVSSYHSKAKKLQAVDDVNLNKTPWNMSAFVSIRLCLYRN